MRDSFDKIRGPKREIRKVVVVMPAYNAESTLRATCEDLPKGVVDQVILVDDFSTDNTVAIARELGLTVVQHDRNRGYGANQKTCYDMALKTEADVIVMLHPDYQYDARLIPHFLGFLEMNICDIMIGSRIRTRGDALASGMPLYKYLSNRLLTILENIILGQNLGDFHSGFRIYTREVLERIPYHCNSDDFVFDSEFLAQAAHFGFRIGDAPVPCRYFEEASSIKFARSCRYGLGTLLVLAKFILARRGIFTASIFREGTVPLQEGAGEVQ